MRQRTRLSRAAAHPGRRCRQRPRSDAQLGASDGGPARLKESLNVSAQMLCSPQSHLLDVLLVLLGAATTCGQLEQQQASPSAAAGAVHQCPPGHVIEQDAVCDGCRRCGPGKEPGSGSAECIPCRTGRAELDGVCSECPPGRHQNSLQTGCDECPAGRYRGVEAGGNWDSAECAECPEGMISAAGSTRHMDCHCPVGTYDRREWGTYDGRKMNGSFVRPGRSSPITCFRSGLSIGRTLGERQAENLASFTDYYQLEHTKRNCVRCPTCVECGEQAASAYSGRPTVKAGWTVLRDEAHLSVEAKAAMRHAPPFDLREGHQSVLMVMSGRRDVFGCPYDEKLWAQATSMATRWTSGREHIVESFHHEVCPSERTVASKLADRAALNASELCHEGYVGQLCAVCANNFRKRESGCFPCDSIDEASPALIMLAGLIFGTIVLAKVIRRLYPKSAIVLRNGVQFLSLVSRTVRSMFSQVRVLISVYQMIGNMGIVLSVTWPPHCAYWIGVIRGLVTIDFFSLPGMDCLVRGNYYHGFWGIILVPIILLLVVYTKYRHEYAGLHLGHIPDLEKDRVARSHLDMVHEMERKIKEAKNQDSHRLFGIFRRARRWDTYQEEKELNAIKEQVFEDEQVSAQEHLLLVMMKIVDAAGDSEASIDRAIADRLSRTVVLDPEEQKRQDSYAA